jgi:membrane protein required for colicin V production
MNIADYLIIAIVLTCGVVGLLRGFLREIIALVTWILALLLAWHFAGYLEPQLGGALASPQVRPWAARVLLLALCLLIGAGAGATIVYFVRLGIFGGIDRLLGLVCGLLRGLLLLGVLVLFCQTLSLDGERWWRHSLLMPYAEDAAGFVRAMVGESIHMRRRDPLVWVPLGQRTEGRRSCAASSES